MPLERFLSLPLVLLPDKSTNFKVVPMLSNYIFVVSQRHLLDDTAKYLFFSFRISFKELSSFLIWIFATTGFLCKITSLISYPEINVLQFWLTYRAISSDKSHFSYSCLVAILNLSREDPTLLFRLESSNLWSKFSRCSYYLLFSLTFFS